MVVAVPCVPAAAIERHALVASLDSITIEQLDAHVKILADDTFEGRQAGSRGGQAAAHYLLEHLRRTGLAPAGLRGRYDQPFGGAYRNLLAMREGRDPTLKDQFVLIGAHYDHVGYGSPRTSYGPLGYIHNGADDNASGTAALLAIAEALAQLPEAPRRSILFALWDGEEIGLLGSWQWLREPTVPLDHLRLAVNLDMIGRLGAKGVEVYGSRSSPGLRQLVSRQNDQLNLTLSFPWNTVDNSDHYPFFLRRVPILMFHTGLHEDYHRPSDDAHKVNREGMRDITRLVAYVVCQLADEPAIGGFREASRFENASTRWRFERPLPPLPSRLGIRWRRPADVRPGLVLTHIEPGSAADRGGLRAGDRLIRLADREVTDEDAFRRHVLGAESPISAVVERPGHEQSLQLELDLTQDPIRLGIAWRGNEAEPGAVILTRVVPGSAAHQAGLLVQDRIYELAGRPFATSSEFQQLATSLLLPIEMLIERRGKLQTIVLPM